MARSRMHLAAMDIISGLPSSPLARSRARNAPIWYSVHASGLKRWSRERASSAGVNSDGTVASLERRGSNVDEVSSVELLEDEPALPDLPSSPCPACRARDFGMVATGGQSVSGQVSAEVTTEAMSKINE